MLMDTLRPGGFPTPAVTVMKVASGAITIYFILPAVTDLCNGSSLKALTVVL